MSVKGSRLSPGSFTFHHTPQSVGELGPRQQTIHMCHASRKVVHAITCRQIADGMAEEFDARIPTFMVDHWTAHGFGSWIVIHKPDQQYIGH
jgi:hypothetical protein